MRWRTSEAFKPRLASFLFLLHLGATLASWSLLMVWSTSGWELTSEGIWQSVRRARTEFFLRNSFLCPEQILKLRAKLIHGFKPTSVKTIKTSSEQKLPNAETSSVHSNSMSRKLQVTIEPSDTHYITKKSNQITSTIYSRIHVCRHRNLAALYTF